MEDIAGVEGGDGVVAAGEVAEIVEMFRAFLRKLFFDKTNRLLVVIGEQAHKGLFLRIHALICN